MNAKTEAQDSRLDSLKMLIAVLLASGAVVAFYYFSEQSLLVRVIGLLALVGVAVAIAARTEVGRRTLGFMGDARTEVRKVVWPTRAETIQTTLAVLLVVLIVGVFLWLVDMLLRWGVQAVTALGS